MKRLGKLAKSVASVMALVMAFSVFFSSGLTTQAATESKEIFSGGSNESYESNDASWLMNADDSDVIKIVYTCTDDTHAGWGVLGWGATVDDNWKDGPGLSASEKDATAKVTAKVTAGDLKKTLGIKDGSNVSFIKLGAWNGGKIESLSISGAGAASVDSSASTDAAATEEVVIQAPPELTGDYLYLLDEAKTITIWPDMYLPYWVPGQTIHLKIEMESNGSFGGCLGTCVNKWAWQMEEFSSDTGSTITVDWFLTPTINNIQLQFWWMSGSQIGIKSIEVVKAVDYNTYSVSGGNSSADTPTEDAYTGNANASHYGSFSLADSSWWTEREISLADLIGDVDPATVTSIVFNGNTDFIVGYNSTASGWQQPSGAKSYTLTDVYMSDNAEDEIDYMLKLCISKGNGVAYDFTWDVYTNGATPAVDSSEDSGSENVKTDSHTFAVAGDGAAHVINFSNFFSDLQATDEVKVTVTLSSTGGWFGGCIGYNDAGGNWTSPQIDTMDTPYTVTVPANNEVQIQQWWIGGADVTADITLEKVVK